MRSINKLLVTCITLASLGLGSCTKNFKDINTDPNGIYPNQVSVDYAYLGEPLNQAQLNIYGYIDYVYQIQQNLNADIYSGYMMSSDPFYTNNQNNTNYFMVDAWNSQFWDLAYNSVMAPIATVLQATKGNNQFAPFYAWAKILRVEAMHRLSDQMGPIVYSHYGQTNPDGSSTYDSQQDVYTAFFNELDSSIATFTTAAATGLPAPFAKFDLVYGGSYNQWLKFANTLRLRLAIRISNVDAALAQKEGEKSLSDPAGLLSVAGDNALINIGSNEHPIDLISESYQDINMGAPILCYMKGYNDPRIPFYARPALDSAVKGQYIGIREGIVIGGNDGSRYYGYSLPIHFSSASGNSHIQMMTAAEAWFLKAEAALRGWAGAGSAQTDYENGITTSFSQYGINSAASYIGNATSTEQPYVDPRAYTPGQNDVPAGNPNLSTITIKWNDADPFATKLERIITQKWIATFPDGQEGWSEFRRTRFPKLFPVVINNSGGLISTDKFIRRMPFAPDEYSSDANGVAGAVKLLGGPDNGGTPLWWDTNPK